MNVAPRGVLSIVAQLLWISLLIFLQRIVYGFQLRTNALCRTAAQYGRNVALAAVDDKEPDLFEYFDPLLSPHLYPKGISSNSKPVQPADEIRNNAEDAFSFRSSLNMKKPFGIEIPPSTVEINNERSMVDTATTFDPTLSPHTYSAGRVPDTIVGDNDADYLHTNERVVGILLMDHGSRNSASNRRLHELAKLYEESLQKNDYNTSPTRTIVRAAHMEIATPTIQDGIASLLEMGVDEIVCHPFFLSPGRHVQEDIPRIVKDAIDALNVSIPVKTSAHIGSQTEIMIGAIHSLVSETSEIIETN